MNQFDEFDKVIIVFLHVAGQLLFFKLGGCTPNADGIVDPLTTVTALMASHTFKSS
jgi:hypothetical protein